MIKNGLYFLVLAAVVGWFMGVGKINDKYTQELESRLKSQPASANVVTKIVTQIKYVERSITANAGLLPGAIKEDMVANVGKQDFTVKVNGEDYQFTKADNEKFMFEKGQLELDQQSNVGVDIQIKPIDLTKRWGIGVGFGLRGPAAVVTGPIIGPLDWWGEGDVTNISGGVIVRF